MLDYLQDNLFNFPQILSVTKSLFSFVLNANLPTDQFKMVNFDPLVKTNH